MEKVKELQKLVCPICLNLGEESFVFEKCRHVICLDCNLKVNQVHWNPSLCSVCRTETSSKWLYLEVGKDDEAEEMRSKIAELEKELHKLRYKLLIHYTLIH